MTLFKGKGRRNFDKCQVHTVPQTGVDTKAYGLDFGGWFNARLAGPEEKIHTLVSTQCPKLGEYILAVHNSTVAEAKTKLADTIGEEACKNCMFARMTPMEVVEHQNALIQAQQNNLGQWAQPPSAQEAAKQLPSGDLR